MAGFVSCWKTFHQFVLRLRGGDGTSQPFQSKSLLHANSRRTGGSGVLQPHGGSAGWLASPSPARRASATGTGPTNQRCNTREVWGGPQALSPKLWEGALMTPNSEWIRFFDESCVMLRT